MSGDRTFTVREAAAYLGVRVDEIYRLLRSGKLIGRKVGVGKFASHTQAWVIPGYAVRARKKVKDKENG